MLTKTSNNAGSLAYRTFFKQAMSGEGGEFYIGPSMTKPVSLAPRTPKPGAVYLLHVADKGTRGSIQVENEDEWSKRIEEFDRAYGPYWYLEGEDGAKIYSPGFLSHFRKQYEANPTSRATGTW